MKILHPLLIPFLFLLFVIPFAKSQVKIQCGVQNKVVVDETQLGSKVSQLLWLEPDYQFAFIRTAGRELWRSTNSGRSWINQIPFLPGGATLQPPFGRSGVKNWQTSSNPSVTYFYGDQTIWVTQNSGRTYQNYTIPGDYLNDVQVHPTRESWLLAEVRSIYCFRTGGDCFNKLVFSEDYGETWRELQTYFYQFTWGNAGLEGTNGVVPEGTIWILDWQNKTGNIYLKSRDDLELRHTTDLFGNVNSVRKDTVFMLHYHNNTYLAEKDSERQLSLWVSEDDGDTFNKAIFPAHELGIEDQYSILDDTEGAIFINVRHGQKDWGNLYTSNRLGSMFELSLEYNRRERNRVNFLRLNGLEGIYIANQLIENGDQSKVLSVITWDKGGYWRQLTSDAQEKIPLQLHGAHKRYNNEYEPFGPIYSNANAIGLVLGVGNGGASLSDEFDVTNTYFSRDAGYTWQVIANGSYIYEFADHGGLLLMADSTGDTDRIIYSWNEGQSFANCIFTTVSTEVTVQNIIANPKLSSQSFLLYGHSQESPGYIAHIDFTGLQERQCTDADYEEWSPFDPENINTECLNGREVKYKRRKRDSECFNGDEYEIETSVKTCACQKEDYECDICYERKGKECVIQEGCEAPKPPSPCKDTYTVPSGYRKVPGDFCSPDLPNMDVRVLPCPSNSGNNSKSPSGLSGGVVALIVIIVLLVLGGAVGALVFLKMKNKLPTFGTYKKFREDTDTMLDPDLLQGPPE